MGSRRSARPGRPRPRRAGRDPRRDRSRRRPRPRGSGSRAAAAARARPPRRCSRAGRCRGRPRRTRPAGRWRRRPGCRRSPGRRRRRRRSRRTTRSQVSGIAFALQSASQNAVASDCDGVALPSASVARIWSTPEALPEYEKLAAPAASLATLCWRPACGPLVIEKSTAAPASGAPPPSTTSAVSVCAAGGVRKASAGAAESDAGASSSTSWCTRGSAARLKRTPSLPLGRRMVSTLTPTAKRPPRAWLMAAIASGESGISITVPTSEGSGEHGAVEHVSAEVRVDVAAAGLAEDQLVGRRADVVDRDVLHRIGSEEGLQLEAQHAGAGGLRHAGEIEDEEAPEANGGGALPDQRVQVGRVVQAVLVVPAAGGGIERLGRGGAGRAGRRGRSRRGIGEARWPWEDLSPHATRAEPGGPLPIATAGAECRPGVATTSCRWRIAGPRRPLGNSGLTV